LFFNNDQVNELIRFSLEQKIKLLKTYSNLRDLSSDEENLLVLLRKVLNDLICIAKKIDSNAQLNNFQSKKIEIYKCIAKSLNVYSKQIVDCIKVLNDVLSVIREGNTR
jgi:hypothetical protein